MDIKQLRQALKLKWLNYCEENISWLDKMQIWRSYDRVRRPSSGYILATLSVLEPRLKQILPFLLELNNNPDQIVAALGLNFNPDEELRLLRLKNSSAKNQIFSKPSVQVFGVGQQNKPVLLRIVSDVEQKCQSVSVVAINKSANDHSSLLKAETVRENKHLQLGRSPTITAPVPTATKPVPASVSISEFNFKYQYTGIPVKEISYISSTTNARSLPAWMDEFCPGVNSEQVIHDRQGKNNHPITKN
ncbi:DUF5331 domain-containing protein [Okeanomitos corallinicola TIOX110]|uniref:DUF5331 domain-containing protein n=1 Tax=Okeanomitos corallinicola TIOX110 TaxID=3133117 RepID=A0ABZ2UVZ5_9CYAN